MRFFKQYFATSWILCGFLVGHAQTSFSLLREEHPLPAQLKKSVTKGSTYSLDTTAVFALLSSKPVKLHLSIHFEDKDWEIELQQANILSKNFFVQSTGVERYSRQAAVLYYRGKIKGLEHSFAAISILPNEIMGVIADEKGNINIGRLQNADRRSANNHILYRDADVRDRPSFACEAISAMSSLPAQNNAGTLIINEQLINTEPIDIYFEADNSCYKSCGNDVTATANWVTGIFNIVAALYEADSILVQMSGLKVWDIPDPYATISLTNPMLSAFSENMQNGFPGDLAHLLSRRSLGGGIAYIDVLCNIDRYRTGVSANMQTATNPLPSYSWNSMVITHETGHNLGSNHTQWCGWPGGAIDNCYDTEGNCEPGPAPVNGGTMMSYCHTTEYGINLALGFGPLPGALIRSRVMNSACIYPRISFNTNYQTITEEDANQPNGCLPYTLINLKLGLNYTPSLPAEISLLPTSLTTGLQIGNDKDLSISNFNFSLTDTTPQLIQLRVYDDAVIENKETLMLDYNLADNGTNARKNGIFTLDILSLDHKPDSTPNRLLFQETFDSITSGMGAWTQELIYGVNSPNRWMVGMSGDPQFTSRAAYISRNGISANYAGSSAADSIKVRLQSPLINASGFSGLHLKVQTKCNGGSSQGTGSGGDDKGQIWYSINNGISWTMLRDNIFWKRSKSIDEVDLPENANNSSQLRLGFTWQNDSSGVSNPPFIIDSIILTGTGRANIQTASHAGNSFTALLGPNQTVHFYNPATQNIMASIRNKSNVDFGCTTLELIRTGDSACSAWGQYADEQVAAKTFKITTTHHDANALYELIAYYSSIELDQWAKATSHSISEGILLKSNENITVLPIAGRPQVSNYNSVEDYGSNGDKLFRGRFTGDGTFSIGLAGIQVACTGTPTTIFSNFAGTNYQWQQDSGNGFSNIQDDIIFSGSTGQVLTLNEAPTSWYGFKYRCLVSDSSGAHFSIENTLRFSATWQGADDGSWENNFNWGCGVVPDVNTDVFILGNSSFSPILQENTFIRSVTLKPGALLILLPDVRLEVKH